MNEKINNHIVSSGGDSLRHHRLMKFHYNRKFDWVITAALWLLGLGLMWFIGYIDLKK